MFSVFCLCLQRFGVGRRAFRVFGFAVLGFRFFPDQQFSAGIRRRAATGAARDYRRREDPTTRKKAFKGLGFRVLRLKGFGDSACMSKVGRDAASARTS